MNSSLEYTIILWSKNLIKNKNKYVLRMPMCKTIIYQIPVGILHYLIYKLKVILFWVIAFCIQPTDNYFDNNICQNLTNR